MDIMIISWILLYHGYYEYIMDIVISWILWLYHGYFNRLWLKLINLSSKILCTDQHIMDILIVDSYFTKFLKNSLK